MHLVVDPQPVGKKLHRLEIRANGQYVGEYERSQAADIERKCAEIQAAAALLVDIFTRFGELKVRWSAARREKVVYVNDLERAVVPREHWRPPARKARVTQ